MIVCIACIHTVTTVVSKKKSISIGTRNHKSWLLTLTKYKEVIG